MRAAGALISILVRDGLLGGEVEPKLASISEKSLSGFLSLDPESQEALAIFARESHPSMLGSAASKEGLSIAGLFDTCWTASGKRLMRTWFRRPIVDKDAIEGRFDAITYLLTSDKAGLLYASN